MNKIPTLLKRSSRDMSEVMPQVTPGCEWVLAGEGTPTRKYDGTCVMYFEGRWWARREVRPGRESPPGFWSVEEDPDTGKTVGWIPVEGSPFFKWFLEAAGEHESLAYYAHPEGTYELLGPKINGNPERAPEHILIKHSDAEGLELDVTGTAGDAFSRLSGFFISPAGSTIEGVVWHHPDGRMAKIKGRDFGHKR